jgi:signal transduction histidine kinase
MSEGSDGSRAKNPPPDAVAEQNGTERMTVDTDAATDFTRLAVEQAALRRVAALAAHTAPAADLFSAVVREVVDVLHVPRGWLFRYEPDGAITVLASLNDTGFPVGARVPLDGPSVAATILQTGRPARMDSYEHVDGSMATRARDSGVRSSFGVPIVVNGAVWGLIGVGPTDEHPLPPDTEARLHGFTELVASAISSIETRDLLHRLADRQASLRRIATLVAEGAAAAELFAVVVQEAVRVLEVPAMAIFRFEPDRTTTVVASVSAPMFPVGSHWPLDGPSLSARVFQTGRPARIDDYSELEGTIAGGVRGSGLGSSVGVPIVVDGRVWGMSCVGMTGSEPLPTGVEPQLQEFTELVAVAISNAESRERMRRLAVQQAALRRVATRVAKSATPDEIFGAVAEEVSRILDVSSVSVVRFEPDDTSVIVAAYNDRAFPIGSRWANDPGSLNAMVATTGRSARIDDFSNRPGAIAAAAAAEGVEVGVAVPIVVDGAVWGMVAAGRRRRREALPAYAGSYTGRIVLATEPTREIESRLSAFTEIVATAISNATARAELIASRARIVAAGDEARRRLERNLHDGTQQQLIALGLDLRRLRAAIAPEQRDVQAGLEEAERDLGSVLEEVRELSRGLHPSQLARGGLGPSLRALALKSPIAVEVDVDVDPRPPAPIEIAVYYVVSEAITNAIKHSGASVIAVTVRSDDTTVRATIADDGAGGAVPEDGSGLTGLDDRVEALGGHFALSSPVARGTTISIELPIATVPAS